VFLHPSHVIGTPPKNRQETPDQGHHGEEQTAEHELFHMAYLACGNSGRSSQTESIRAFVLHRFEVWVQPFTKFQRTW
jgi:hypothetical protein